MVSYDKVLPIGTVVLLKNAQRRLMILGYQRTSAEDDKVVYDYCGCVYPDGYISPEHTFLFNHENIDRVYALGLQNDEYKEVSIKLQQLISQRDNLIKEQGANN